MADFVHRIRLGEEVGDVIDEFRDKGHVRLPRPALDGQLQEPQAEGPTEDELPHDRMSKDLARQWSPEVRAGPEPRRTARAFGTPGIVNPVNRGLATRYLRWMDAPNFKRPYKFKNEKTFKPAADDDRSQLDRGAVGQVVGGGQRRRAAGGGRRRAGLAGEDQGPGRTLPAR